TVRKNMETMEMFYHDPQTGELWKSFFPKYTPQDRGPKLLRPEPLPESLELQLKNCLTGSEEVDSMGLGIELSVQPKKWPEIVSLLKKNSSSYRRANFFIFVKYAGLIHPFSSLQEIGETPESCGFTRKDLKRIRRQVRFIKFKRFFGF
ncbi:MAG: hypothetical protein R3220_11450, partial [Balneolaceae bacterium]|nr:hypothetical protein [Balneolaceae bacterium]